MSFTRKRQAIFEQELKRMKRRIKNVAEIIHYFFIKGSGSLYFFNSLAKLMSHLYLNIECRWLFLVENNERSLSKMCLWFPLDFDT